MYELSNVTSKQGRKMFMITLSFVGQPYFLPYVINLLLYFVSRDKKKKEMFLHISEHMGNLLNDNYD